MVTPTEIEKDVSIRRKNMVLGIANYSRNNYAFCVTPILEI